MQNWLGHFLFFCGAFSGVYVVEDHVGVWWPTTAVMCLGAAAVWGYWMYRCGKEDAEKVAERQRHEILQRLYALQREQEGEQTAD